MKSVTQVSKGYTLWTYRLYPEEELAVLENVQCRIIRLMER